MAPRKKKTEDAIPTTLPGAVEFQDELSIWLKEVQNDPYRFVLEAFPWGVEGTELAKHEGPDSWQRDVLCDIRDGLMSANEAIRLATASGHGIGKSCLVAWIILWSLSTFKDSRGVVTANTETQLRTKTWPELGKWYRLSRVREMFVFMATAIYSSDKEYEKTWRCDAITWSESRPEGFAGLHNQGKRIFVIFDEASWIPNIIWETTEGAMTDKDTQIIWAVFGNPTRNIGRFYECFHKARARWITRQIDSRTVAISNKSEIALWVRDEGEDSDFVRVRVRGMFPRVSAMQFIGPELVENAQDPARENSPTLMDPLIFGVDVARYGDNQSVICIRRGRDARSVPWLTFRGINPTQLAGKLAEMALAMRPDAIFVDEGGVGGGVVDRLAMLRIACIPVAFGAAADHGVMHAEGRVTYANKRTEMWGAMRDWLRGGMIPKDTELYTDLTTPYYGYTNREGKDAIMLESKDDMRRRGESSPDKGDALCFVAGTMIRTPTGEVPIEQIQVGDEVVTPFGVTRVGVKWCSKTERLTTARFSNGKSLVGKGAHKIFTWGAGACRLDALPLTVGVEPYSKGRILAWRIVSMLFTEARNIGFKELVAITTRAKPLTARAVCTAAFGLSATVLFRKATSSITKITIGETTTSPILNLCPGNSTISITQKSALARETLARYAVWKKPASPPLFGTRQSRGINGTKNTRAKAGKVKSQSAQSASNAERDIGHFSRRALGIAQKLAHWPRLICANSPTFVRVLGAAKALWRIATGRPRVVPVLVQTECVLPTSVYNLTLIQHNAYYANGILAYNCLTFAYGVGLSDHKSQFSGKPTHQIDYDPMAQAYQAR